MATEHFKRSDEKFSVRAYTELNRHGNPQHRVRFGYRGGDVRTITARSETDAVAKAAQFWQAHIDGLLDAPPTAPVTIGKLVDEFVARGDLAPATKETYQKSLDRFVRFVGEHRELTAIGKAAVAQWFGAMTCKPVSQAAYLRTMRALFGWAVRSKYIDADPSRDIRVERFKTSIRPWLQHHEWAPFLAACRPGHRIRAEFALHVGLRAGELADARWSWLHGTVGTRAITVPASKSARARAIPLDHRAVEVLEEAKGHFHRKEKDADGKLVKVPEYPKPEDLIFGEMDPHNLRRDNVIACRKAGVTVVDFHGLRRSCGARWLEVGIPLFHVSRMLGHADVSTTARHYAGLADSTLAAEIAKVNAAAVQSGNVVPITRARHEEAG
jgi:integrase